MKKLTVILMVLALVFTSVFAQGAAEGATTAKKGSVYWLNFKPESDAVLQEVAKAYTAETGVEVKVVTAASGTYNETLTAEMDKTNPPTLFVVGNQGAVASWGDFCLDLTGTPIANELSTDAYNLYDANGKLLRQEDIIDYTRTNIKGEYASLSDFIHKWKASDKKKTIEQSFMAMGIDLKALKADQGMSDVDDFDFICYVAYGKKPLTRKERANNVKKKDFFSKYSAEAQAVLSILLDKYMNQGITEVEDIKVLSLADFAEFGKPAKIVKLFGGKAQYEAAIKELEANIYELEVS